MVEDEINIVFVVGIYRLGVGNFNLVFWQISCNDVYCILVVDSVMLLMIIDVLVELFFVEGELYQCYGIRFYLGIFLLIRDGVCFGILVVLDFFFYDFRELDVVLMNMIVCWCMGEIEY